jgi:hypothetical protein
MSDLSYGRGEKKVVFDSNAHGLTLNSVGDNLWFPPFPDTRLPGRMSWEIDVSGTISAGAVDLEGSLGQESGLEGPTVTKAASTGPLWFQLGSYTLTGGDSLQFTVDKKVRAVRVRVSTAITGTTPRAIVSVSA